jgi:hypothetical protein
MTKPETQRITVPAFSAMKAAGLAENPQTGVYATLPRRFQSEVDTSQHWAYRLAQGTNQNRKLGSLS